MPMKRVFLVCYKKELFNPLKLIYILLLLLVFKVFQFVYEVHANYVAHSSIARSVIANFHWNIGMLIHRFSKDLVR